MFLCVCVCVYVCVCSSDMMEEEEDDTIHMGNAIMTFYAALIDLLGRCAPEMHVSDITLHTHTRTYTMTYTHNDLTYFVSVDPCW